MHESGNENVSAGFILQERASPCKEMQRSLAGKGVKISVKKAPRALN